MLKFTSILLVAEPDLDDVATVERVVRLAESHRARLAVIDVRPSDMRVGGRLPGDLSEEALREALEQASRETLEPYVEAARGRVECRARTRFGIGFVEVIREVLQADHDLVVKAARTRGSGRGVSLASFDQHLLRKCPVPVWIARLAHARAYGRVLAAVDLDEPDRQDNDGDSLNRRILEAAAAQALADAAELHIVHAWQPPYEGLLRTRGVFRGEEDERRYIESERRWRQQAADELVARLHEWLGDDARHLAGPRVHLRRGPAGETIPAAVRDLGADLLVMGTVGRTGLAGFIIGNTAETILDAIDCSVLALKPPGFRTPVEPEE